MPVDIGPNLQHILETIIGLWVLVYLIVPLVLFVIGGLLFYFIFWRK